jgi:hypothetical protein
MKSSHDSVKALVGVAGLEKILVLNKEKNGSSIAYAEGKPRKEWTQLALRSGGFTYPPFELTNVSWRITFIGNGAQARKFLTIASGFGLHFKVVSASDAMFTKSSFLSVLTEKQRRVLTSAYSLGFFDTPRRIDTRKLAESLELGKSVTIEHLRKAQKRLLNELLTS